MQAVCLDVWVPIDPGVSILDRVTDETVAAAREYIRGVLSLNQVAGSYGAIFMISDAPASASPAIRFGFPCKSVNFSGFPIDAAPPPVFLVDDSIIPTVGTWKKNPVQVGCPLDIAGYSIGEEWEGSDDGAFGLWIRSLGGATYGVTAAHVFPSRRLNTKVTFPSCHEIGLRLDFLKTYTSFCPIPRPRS